MLYISALESSLPHEVLHHILIHLDDPRDLHYFSLTCKRHRILATRDAFWEPIYINWWSSLSDQGAESEFRQKRRKQKLRNLVLDEERCISASDFVPTAEEQHQPLYSIDGLLGSPHQPTQNHHPHTPFYRISCDRLNTEDHFLKRAQHHVNLSHGQLVSALDIAHTLGNSIRDLLHILVWDQQISFDLSEAERRDLHVRLVSQATNEPWPKARHLHLRAISGSPQPHAQYHLALFELAQSLLRYLQRRDAVSSFRQLSQQRRESELGRQREESVDQDARVESRTLHEQSRECSLQAEEALIAMSQFRGVDKAQVVEYLDLLAVYLYMKLRAHSESISTTRDVVKVVLQNLRALSFGVADSLDFFTLDNSFLHVSLFCPHNRATLPLTLNVIFASVASRLGLYVGVSNIPGRIISFVLDSSFKSTSAFCHGAIVEQNAIFFVDGTDEDPIREPDDVVSWARMIGRPEGTKFRSLAWQPTDGASLLSRCAHNILNANRGWTGDEFGAHYEPQIPSHSQSSTNVSRPPPPSSLLYNFLASHPASYDQGASIHRLPASIQPLRRHIACNLPDNRRQCFQSHIMMQATYAALWAENETLNSVMGSRSADWILRYIGDQEILDVGLTSHGEVACAKEAHRQRNFAVARSRQGFIGVNGSDELKEEEEIIPIWALRGHSDGEDDANEDDGESSDSSDAVNSEGTSYPSFKIPYPSHTDELPAYKVIIPQLVSRSLVIPDPKPARLPNVRFPTGTIFQHRMHNYKAVIRGWTPDCQADAAWMQTMNVDSLPEGGRHQPFYHATVEDGSARYVAQCNIKPASESPSSDADVLQEYAKLLAIPGLGKDFRCLDLTLRRLRTLPAARVGADEGEHEGTSS
ncbi:unnamed protein product [Sympodiomycopsis kandeliae]